MDKVKSARALIREALVESQKPCFTCSFQAEDVVVLHLLLEERPDVPVLFLDTGYHFPVALLLWLLFIGAQLVWRGVAHG
nr:phosphoadenosine phosphosulfate reductase family protein [Thermus tenuipuniceus]